MNITNLIAELLQKGQKVELPEIGTFDSVEQPPHHDPVTRIYYPATRNIVYNETTTGDDSIVKIIAQRDCVSEEVARQMWRNYLDALKDKLKLTGEHSLEGLGTITKVGDSYGFEMAEGVVIDAGNGSETLLEEVKTYDHSGSEDPFAQFEDEPEVTVVKKVEATPAPKPEPVAPAPEPEEEPMPAVEPEPEPEPADELEAEHDVNAPKSVSDEWKESLKQLDELPKSKSQLKAEAKAEKERLKAEAKAEKERERLRRRAEKDAEEEERLLAQQREAEERKEASERRRAEEELRKAEERAEQDSRRANREQEESMRRAEEKAAEERIKAEKKAAVLAAVAASQVAKGEPVAAAESAPVVDVKALKAQKEASKEAARKLKEEEKLRKAAEKIAAKEAARQMKEENKKRAKEVVEKQQKEYDDENRRHGLKWLWWLLLLLIAAAVVFLCMKNCSRGDGEAAQAKNGKHLNVPYINALTYNPDLIEYSEREIGRNGDIVCANMAEYINNFLADRGYRSARVPMMDRVRQYVNERMDQLLGPRFAVQRFIPYEDYVYHRAEPWLKHTYADVARHTVQGELMNVKALDEILDQVVDELNLQAGTQQFTPAEVQQVKETERAAAAPKKPAKAQLDKDAPQFVYVEKNSKQGFDIIAGFYLNKGTAAKMTARLHEQGCDAYIIEKNDMYYVSMGSAPTRTKAEALYNHIKSWYDGDIVIKEL